MSQEEAILNHLRKSSITPLEALTLYGCMRLAARIQDLRESGHQILTKVETKNGKRFARYILIRGKTNG